MTEIDRAVALLRAGELVAFPTETVYGLGADARKDSAIAKIFAAKGRPVDHPVIVHIPDASHMAQWAVDIPPAAHRLAEAWWPGPLTIILRRHPEVSLALTGGQDTIGLRVPNHPLALALLQAFDGGIAAPSANRFGRISPTTAAAVREELGEVVPLIIDGGDCHVGIESTIVDLTSGSPKILRPGMITQADLTRVLSQSASEMLVCGPDLRAPRVSGDLDAHYAPRTPLILATPSALDREVGDAIRQGAHVAVLTMNRAVLNSPLVTQCRGGEGASEYAHSLYANLRHLDTLGVARIFVEQVPEGDDWQGVADRLRRAAFGSGIPIA
jgi:L-threonylcarbamoyladenylate synthase